MTSTQLIPLTPASSIINPISKFTPVNKYNNPQLIFNSDRITINSKKEDIIITAENNINLNTDNIANINAGNYIHLHIPAENKDSKILLGTKSDNTSPDEPVLLGNQTHDLLLDMLNTLTTLAGYLSSATVATSDGSLPISSVNDGGTQLLSDVENLINRLGTIQSTKVYTV
jgi:hypothetical protein